jgi:hypothetical protein
MENLQEVIDFYKLDCSNLNNVNKNEIIYTTFEKNVKKFPNIEKQFNITAGFGELSFSWSWYLLVKSMPDTFTFLEIGVYKGRILSLIQLLSNMLNKNVKIYGVTPLDGDATDKYSEYEKIDYLSAIKKSYSISNIPFTNTEIIHGYSQEESIIKKTKETSPYDMVFIDGCHDYEIVIQDINNYSEMIKPYGYLILDDASLYIENPYGSFLGHPDVGKAIQQTLDKDPRFVHLYAIGHNRIWQKISI